MQLKLQLCSCLINMTATGIFCKQDIGLIHGIQAFFTLLHKITEEMKDNFVFAFLINYEILQSLNSRTYTCGKSITRDLISTIIYFV